MAHTVGSLAALVKGQVCGDATLAIAGLTDLQTAGPQDLSFFVQARYLPALLQTQAAAVLLQTACEAAPCTQIICADPYLAMAQAAHVLQPLPTPQIGVAPSAWVSPHANVDASVTLGPGVVVEDFAVIGPDCVLQAQAYVGPHARLGRACHLWPGAKVMARCVLGERVMLHPGSVVGSDGFGFAADAQGVRHKIPQQGIVQLEDDVEVGANSTIDRATFGVTLLGRGTKLDNHVQIGHNVRTGCDCIFVSQAGVAGSTCLGDRVLVGAQGGFAPHLQIASDTQFAARAGATRHVKEAGVYAGFPLQKHAQWRRNTVLQKNLLEMQRRLAMLEAHLAQRGTAPQPVGPSDS